MESTKENNPIAADAAPQEKQSKFNADEVTAILKEIAESTIQDAVYTHSKVPQWNKTIIESCLKRLRAKNKNYKFVVTCVIIQRTGAGFYASSSVYWDNANDGSASYRHETKSLYAIINAFGLCAQ